MKLKTVQLMAESGGNFNEFNKPTEKDRSIQQSMSMSLLEQVQKMNERMNRQQQINQGLIDRMKALDDKITPLPSATELEQFTAAIKSSSAMTGQLADVRSQPLFGFGDGVLAVQEKI